MRERRLLTLLLVAGLVALPACRRPRARYLLDPSTQELDLLAIGRLPEPPSGLIPNGSPNVDPNVTLFWDASRGASSYNVSLGTTPEPPLVVNTSKTSFSRKLTPGTTYFWLVTALSPDGSTSSEMRSFKTSGVNPCHILAEPELEDWHELPRKGSMARYEIAWTEVECATAYEVDEAKGLPLSKAVTRTIRAPQPRFTFEHTSSDGSIFFYRIRAIRVVPDKRPLQSPPSLFFGLRLGWELDEE